MFAKFSYYQLIPLNLKKKMNVLSSGDHSQKRKLSLMILFLNTNNIDAHKVISHTVCLNTF